MKKLRKYYIWLIVLNALAIPITLYLTYLHLAPHASTICNFGEALNCDIVNQSIYSEIFGIPVALLGLLTYLILMIFSIRGLYKDQTKLIPYVTIFVFIGVLFALYLTGVETFILKTYCIFCVAQQIIILIEFGIFIKLFKLTKKA